MEPLTIPRIRVTLSPASDSLSGRIIGIAAATAASKYSCAPTCSATLNSSVPWVAIRNLFAVITSAPEFKAIKMYSLAGSIPPMTSITMSAPSIRLSASVVKRFFGNPSRLTFVSRTRTPTSSSSAPTRDLSSALCSSNSLATSAPTDPAPSNATRMGRYSLNLISLPTTKLPCLLDLVSGVSRKHIGFGLGAHD